MWFKSKNLRIKTLEDELALWKRKRHGQDKIAAQVESKLRKSDEVLRRKVLHLERRNERLLTESRRYKAMLLAEKLAVGDTVMDIDGGPSYKIAGEAFTTDKGLFIPTVSTNDKGYCYYVKPVINLTKVHIINKEG